MEFIEKNEDICLLDNVTTHTLLIGKHYFSSLTLCKANVHIISGLVEIIYGSGDVTITLTNDSILDIEDALLSSRLKRNLLSFKDVFQNGYHLETVNA